MFKKYKFIKMLFKKLKFYYLKIKFKEMFYCFKRTIKNLNYFIILIWTSVNDYIVLYIKMIDQAIERKNELIKSCRGGMNAERRWSNYIIDYINQNNIIKYTWPPISLDQKLLIRYEICRTKILESKKIIEIFEHGTGEFFYTYISNVTEMEAVLHEFILYQLYNKCKQELGPIAKSLLIDPSAKKIDFLSDISLLYDLLTKNLNIDYKSNIYNSLIYRPTFVFVDSKYYEWMFIFFSTNSDLILIPLIC